MSINIEKLLAACETGLLVSSTLIEPVIIDFAVPAADTVFFTHAGWWRMDWGLGVGYGIIRGPAVEDGNGWKMLVGDNVSVYLSPFDPLDDEPSVALQIKRMREDIDVNREDYLKALVQLQLFIAPEYGTEAWEAVVKKRPTINVIERLIEAMSGVRRVGGIFLRGNGGVVLDCLLLDERGQHGIAAGTNKYLNRVAAGWTAYADSERPDLDGYIRELADQPFPGLCNDIEVIPVREMDGNLDAIAARMLPRQ